MPVDEPYVPYSILVHLGPPDSDAQNVRVLFSDYIKNVASSEIYPTWDEEAIRANVYAQISFALNRIYTEYYRSRGYDFDITNDTAIDQKFIFGRDVFDNVSKLVNEIFNTYIRRVGNTEPLAAKYCNGTTVTCDGLSQWGSQALAEDGLSAIQILYNYYGTDIELVSDAPVRGVTESYPGEPLTIGSEGDSVRIVQTELNRISQSYPTIPKLADIDGVFGTLTEEAVTAFQQIFGLEADGIVGKATWYKMIFVYTGVTRLSELDSEGNALFDLSLEYPDAIALGDRGEKVVISQYLLALAAEFYECVRTTEINGVFGEETRASVVSFQEVFGLPQTGVIDALTWNQLYNVFRGIYDRVLINDEIFPVRATAYPGEPLSVGSSGDAVTEMQQYLNTISLAYPSITPVVPSGRYDRRTQSAVAEYQRLFGLPITGTVDKATWTSIVNTYKNVLSVATPRPTQYPGNPIKLGDTDSEERSGNER